MYMNYKRIIGTIVIKNGIAVQSIGFNKYLPIGKPEIVVEFLCSWGIDEIIVADIDATRENRSFDLNLLSKLAKKCFVPLTIVGGVKDIEAAKNIISGGADKLGLNSILFSNIGFVEKLSHMFGTQCVVGSVVHKKSEKENIPMVYSYQEKKITNIPVIDFCKTLEKNGVGEIMLTSVDGDGSLCGFDISTIKNVASECNVPVIAASGAGKVVHFEELFLKTDAAACAVGNFWNYTEHSVANLKSILKQKNNIQIRFESGLPYLMHDHDQSARVLAPGEEYLEKLLFTRIEREVL